MRDVRREGAAGKGRINRGRGGGVAAEVVLKCLVVARPSNRMRIRRQGLEAIGVSKAGGDDKL
jgi:hypothetical protein